MLSESLEESLRRYAIGEKVRALRLGRKMGLVELGRHTGLSPALLSKIERTRMYPPLPTLMRIAMVFGVGLDFFFTDGARTPVISIVRKKDRQPFPSNPDGPHVSYWFESLDFKATDRRMTSYLARFEPAADGVAEQHAHEGVEMLYVIEGKLAIRIGTEEHQLAAGDAIYFDSGVTHSYRRASRSRCSAIVTTCSK